MTQQTYLVGGMTCQHCVNAVREEVGRIPGVQAVDVDLDSKRVVVQGEGVTDDAVRAAVEEAGYEVTG